MEVIAKHDPSVPLFHFWSPHIAHTPLAAPDSALAHFSFMSNEQQSRYYYSAMVWYMDQLLGKVVNAIKAKGMWDSTLMVLSADNGGPLYFDSQSPGLFAGANNYPLKVRCRQWSEVKSMGILHRSGWRAPCFISMVPLISL